MTDTVRPSSNTSPSVPAPVVHSDNGNGSLHNNDVTLEKWSRTPRPRGRQAKDPMAREVRYQCAGMENLESNLHDYIANPTGPPEHTTVEFTFPSSAAFMVSTTSTAAAAAKDVTTLSPLSHGRTAVSIVDALGQADPKERLRKQRAIAKAVVDGVSAVDGYRYSFHNSWVSKEDEALRFSYFCNDSTLNKGRAANEGAGMAGKKKVKPVYDCKGVIHIKFSATKQTLQVHYRHVPLHQTYEARAPPPRKGSKRRQILELIAPEKLPKHNVKANATSRSSHTEPRRRKKRTTHAVEEPPSATAAADDALAPILDFLDSAQQEGGAGGGSSSQTLDLNRDELQQASSERVDPTTSRGGTGNKRARGSVPNHSRSKASSIPGTMAGYLVQNDLGIEWAFDQDKSTAQGQVTNLIAAGGGGRALQGIAAAATATATSSGIVAEEQPAAPDPASELDILRQKLMEAEERIKSLEAERRIPVVGAPGWQHQHQQSSQQSYGTAVYSYHHAFGPSVDSQYQYSHHQHQQHQQPR